MGGVGGGMALMKEGAAVCRITALSCGLICKLQLSCILGEVTTQQLSDTSDGDLLSQCCQPPAPSALIKVPESIRWSDRAAVSVFSFQSYFIIKICADRTDYVSKYGTIDFVL